MSKREFIDKEKLIVDMQISSLYHAQNAREESLMYRDRNIVREQPTFTEQDIVKPYLDKMKEKLSQIGFDYYFQCGEYLGEDVRKIKIMNFDRAMEIIDNLLSEQGDTV